VLVQVVVVFGLGADDGASLAGLGEVDVRVRGGEGRVGGADDGAVGGEGGGGHFGLRVTSCGLRVWDLGLRCARGGRLLQRGDGVEGWSG